MIEESQNIEHKESWRDEYLKWICGFANAQGGRVYIGVADDRQVDEVMRLLEERYLIRAISYEKHHRREKIQYPEDSLRESVLNAITNKDYTSGYPIQISVYPDHLSDKVLAVTIGFATIKWLIIASQLHHLCFKIQGLRFEVSSVSYWYSGRIAISGLL